MYPLLLILIGSSLIETTIVIGKKAISKHQETFYQLGFLQSFYQVIFFFVFSLFGQKFVFNFQSLPTFSLRIIFEILQLELSLRAIVKADRSTYSFFKAITIPLLLMVDLFLGYKISLNQIFGIVVIVISLFLLQRQNTTNKKGLIFVIAAALNAVITISLFKYDTTRFNSIAAEQSIILIILMGYLGWKIKTKDHRSLFKTMFDRPFQLQSIINGLGSSVLSFAYMFGTASVITTFQRTADVFCSILSGKMFFKEKGFINKLFLLILISASLILMSVK
jgi:hypothetical protein